MKIVSKFKNIDYFILIPLIMLSVIGLVMVYSASAGMTNDPKNFLFKQVVSLIIGMLCLTFTFCFNFKKLNQIVMFFIYVCFLLSFIYLHFSGESINGSAGWISIGQFNFQPAEFIKFYLIVAYTKYADAHQNKIEQSWFKGNMPIWIFAAIPCLLIFFLPDLGAFAMCCFIILAMSLTMMKNKFKAIGFSILFLLIVVLGLLFAANHDFGKSYYQLQRLTAFAHPFANIRGIGQQLVNSYYAFSNGGLFGVGLGNSIQKHGHLPEPNTDFIMAIISEELGAIFVILIICLLLIIIIKTIIVGMNSTNLKSVLFCYGVATFIFVEAFFNIGGVIGLLPITGVTFPFVSYGGSSIITLCLCLGGVLKISSDQKKEKNEERLR